VDSEENTIDFYLNKTSDSRAAKYFFKKALWSFHIFKSRIITVYKHPVYLIVIIEELKKENKMTVGIQIKQFKYLNNIVE
jgi:transposase-like protein